jgi:hypothetical protein
MLAGQVIVGLMLSLTVTVKLQVDMFPDASVALWVTVVTPAGKLEPLAGPAVLVIVIGFARHSNSRMCA